MAYVYSWSRDCSVGSSDPITKFTYTVEGVIIGLKEANPSQSVRILSKPSLERSKQLITHVFNPHVLQPTEKLSRPVEIAGSFLLLHGLDQQSLGILAERQPSPQDLGTPDCPDTSDVRTNRAKGKIVNIIITTIITAAIMLFSPNPLLKFFL